MCKWGTNVRLSVPVTPTKWEEREVDACLANLIGALNAAGILTRNCCCGHSKADGSILLHDGRELIIKKVMTKDTIINCPFCGDKDFDHIGLKLHLTCHCEVFQNIEDVGKLGGPFSSRALREAKEADEHGSKDCGGKV